ncbi:MAG: hypothetical protein N3B18_06155 [Desulfobacterota bacterium]|nr:hypothetical protein [Thermodesulfobacteriota bacterium]
MGWFSDFHDELQKENQGLKIYQTRVFWEALSVVVLTIRGMAECFEYFPMTIMQPVQSWGIHMSERLEPYFRWVPGPEGVTSDIFSLWVTAFMYQVPVILGFILLNYVLITIFKRERPSFWKVVMATGIAMIPYKTWWYSASGEAVWVITPQIIHLGFPGDKSLVPPVQTIEAYWRTYIMTGLIFFMWSMALMYGLNRYLFHLKRWQGYLLNLPWVFYCTYVISGIWGSNPRFTTTQITGYVVVMVVVAWAILIGGKTILEAMGKQRFVDTYGGKIAGWVCVIIAACYFEFTFRQGDKINIENELMIQGGHYESIGKTIDRMEALEQEGKIVITSNAKMVDPIYQKNLALTKEKQWTYADIIRTMIEEEYKKKKHLKLTPEEARTLIRWDEKNWLPFHRMDPEIGKLIRCIAAAGEGGAA